MGVRMNRAAWAQQAALYQINVRQFTPQGTLAAIEAELPRIAALGVGVLWFMPIQPIGVAQRKGGLGSYYSIRHYTEVNPEFGTLADFKRLVERAHGLGLKVILDWVANHTAWDHPWTTEHPDWYKKDEHGRIHSYVYRPDGGGSVEYWTDVVGLDWTQPALWPAMTEAMLFWMREAGIDGFRCDVAALVPLGFWAQLRPQLEAVRPVFMLAEAHEPEMHRHGFDATYDWGLLDQLKRIAQGEGDARLLQQWWAHRLSHYQPTDLRLLYTANHDSNSWHGSCLELFGSVPAFKACATLAALLPGMPLIYGGQESFFRKRLQFFEKDPIDWGQHELSAHYRALFELHRQHPALRNEAPGDGESFHWLPVHEASGTHEVYRVAAFERRVGPHAVRVVVNLGPQAQAVRVAGQALSLQGWQAEVLSG